MVSHIQELSQNVRSKLRSGIAITSVTQCIEELVLNAIDSGAVNIAIRVDLEIFRIQVVDNGHGIREDDMKLIGKRYATSKCYSLEDLKSNLTKHGYRGEALASIIQISGIVDVTSRYKSSSCTYSKLFTYGKEKKIMKCDPNRPSFGTTITIQDFLYNMPVRRKLIKESIDIEKIKTQIERIILMSPNVSVTLRNDRNKSMVLQLNKSKSVLNMFLQLFGNDHEKNMAEIYYSNDPFEIEGYISTQPYQTKSLQFVYINKRFVKHTKINNLMNDLLSRSSIIRSRSTPNSICGPGKLPSSPPKGLKYYGIFVLNITCPHNEYDICLEPKKTLVEFKDWDRLLACVEEMVLKFIKEENLTISLDERFRKSEKDVQSLDFEAPIPHTSQEFLQTFSNVKLKTNPDEIYKPCIERKIEISDVKAVVHSLPARRRNKVETSHQEVNKHSDLFENLEEIIQEPTNSSLKMLDESEYNEGIRVEKNEKTIAYGNKSSLRDLKIMHFTNESEVVSPKLVLKNYSKKETSNSELSSLQALKLVNELQKDTSECKHNAHITPENKILPSVSPPTLKTWDSTGSKRDLSTINNLKNNVSQERCRNQSFKKSKQSLSNALSKQYKEVLKKEKFIRNLHSFKYKKLNHDSNEFKDSNKKDEDIHNKKSEGKNIKLNPIEISNDKCDQSFHFNPVIISEKTDDILSVSVNNSFGSASEDNILKDIDIEELVKDLPSNLNCGSEVTRNELNNPQSNVLENFTFINPELNLSNKNKNFQNTIFNPTEVFNNHPLSKHSNSLIGNIPEKCVLDSSNLLPAPKNSAILCNGNATDLRTEILNNGNYITIKPLVPVHNEPNYGENTEENKCDSVNIPKHSVQASNIGQYEKNPSVPNCTKSSGAYKQVSVNIFPKSTAINNYENLDNESLVPVNHKAKCSEKLEISKSNSISTPLKSLEAPSTQPFSVQNSSHNINSKAVHALECEKNEPFADGNNCMMKEVVSRDTSEVCKLTHIFNNDNDHVLMKENSGESTDIQYLSIEPLSKTLDIDLDIRVTEESTLETLPSRIDRPLTQISNSSETTLSQSSHQTIIKSIKRYSQMSQLHFQGKFISIGSSAEDTEKPDTFAIENNSTTSNGNSKAILNGNASHGTLSGDVNLSSEVTDTSNFKPSDSQDAKENACFKLNDSSNNDWKKVSNKCGTDKEIYVNLRTGNTSFIPPPKDPCPEWKSSQSMGCPTLKIPITDEFDNCSSQNGVADQAFTLTHGYKAFLSTKRKIPTLQTKSEPKSKRVDSSHFTSDNYSCDKSNGHLANSSLQSSLANNKEQSYKSTGYPKTLENNNKNDSTSQNWGSNVAHRESLNTENNISTKAYEALNSFLKDNALLDCELSKWAGNPNTQNDDSDLTHIHEFWEKPQDYAMDEEILTSNAEIQNNGGLASNIKSYNIVHPYKFTREMLKKCKVFGQVDKKFIAISLSLQDRTLPLIILVDQHAADERVQLEMVWEQSYEVKSFADGSKRKVLKSERANPPIETSFREDQVRIMMCFREAFFDVGLQFTQVNDTTVIFHCLPCCLVAKEPNEKNTRRCQTAALIVEAIVVEMCENIQLLGGTLSCEHVGSRPLPKPLTYVMNTIACRSAIKFGDELSDSECVSLISSLSNCKLPFQCAHGRPSLIPICDLNYLKLKKKVQKPNLKRIQNFSSKI